MAPSNRGQGPLVRTGSCPASLPVILAVALLLAVPIPGVAQTAAMFSAIEQAVAKGETEKSKTLGSGRQDFSELPRVGALLVGFDLGIGKFLDKDIVCALRPIYLTADGESYYHDFGLFVDKRLPGNKIVKSKVVRTVRLQAPSGYAVAGLSMHRGLFIDGLMLTFMRIDGKRLDPTATRTSDWVGNHTGGNPSTLMGGGRPVVGVFGRHDEVSVTGLGLVYANTAKPLPKVAETPKVSPTPVLPKEKTKPVEPPVKLEPVTVPPVIPPVLPPPPTSKVQEAEPVVARKVDDETKLPWVGPYLGFLGVVFLGLAALLVYEGSKSSKGAADSAPPQPGAVPVLEEIMDVLPGDPPT